MAVPITDVMEHILTSEDETDLGNIIRKANERLKEVISQKAEKARLSVEERIMQEAKKEENAASMDKELKEREDAIRKEDEAKEASRRQ